MVAVDSACSYANLESLYTRLGNVTARFIFFYDMCMEKFVDLIMYVSLIIPYRFWCQRDISVFSHLGKVNVFQCSVQRFTKKYNMNANTSNISIAYYYHILNIMTFRPLN